MCDDDGSVIALRAPPVRALCVLGRTGQFERQPKPEVGIEGSGVVRSHSAVHLFKGDHGMKKYLFAAFLVVGLALVLAPPQAFAQEEKPFTVHGEVRMRGEYDNNASDFNDDADDGGLFYPYRVRIAVEGKFTHNVDAYIEVQSVGVGGGDSSFLTAIGAPNYQTPRW